MQLPTAAVLKFHRMGTAFISPHILQTHCLMRRLSLRLPCFKTNLADETFSAKSDGAIAVARLFASLRELGFRVE